ncbi:MAG: PPC domain-containing DNA-binding protein [candidate division Zixibacteria bacterium]
MKFRKVTGGFLVRLDKGEEVIESLQAFIAKQKIPAGVLQGIGAVRNIQIGYFDTRRNKYQTKQINKTIEVVSLIGNISYINKRPFVHAHITVADSNYKLTGGHFFKGEVAVTLEVFIRVLNKKLNRKKDPKTGFNFWDL